MSEFRQEARELVDEIAVLQCSVVCPELTPASTALSVIKRGTQIRMTNPDIIADLLSYIAPKSPSNVAAIGKKIEDFVTNHRSELEDVLIGQAAKQQFYSTHSGKLSR